MASLENGWMGGWEKKDEIYVCYGFRMLKQRREYNLVVDEGIESLQCHNKNKKIMCLYGMGMG